jgi:hypothetical protein
MAMTQVIYQASEAWHYEEVLPENDRVMAKGAIAIGIYSENPTPCGTRESYNGAAMLIDHVSLQCCFHDAADY